MFYRIAIIIVFAFTLFSCEKIALMTTAKKKPIASHSKLAELAEKDFWDTLHSGQYQNIPNVTELLTAAYLENPNDPKLAAHLGFIHIWKITERAREKPIAATITNEIILAHKYFSDAVQLDRSDARFLGFLGDSTLIEGKIFHDARESVRGYFILKDAIQKWPEFNYFTAGYPMSILDPHSDQFKDALRWQWKTLDLCAGTKINRNNPDFTLFLNRETQTGPERACWNSWIAPHNFEGFFMNMGDMLVKTGDVQTAIVIYNNAKLSKTYSEWPYHEMLEKRIQEAQENVKRFQGENAAVMFNSGYGCMACHQQK